jgi:hypothetical protein
MHDFQKIEKKTMFDLKRLILSKKEEEKITNHKTTCF